jgi:hypothetical protein
MGYFNKIKEKRLENQFAYIGLAAVCTSLGREEKASAAAAELLGIDPRVSLDHYAKILASKNQKNKDHLINTLRKQGLK